MLDRGTVNVAKVHIRLSPLTSVHLIINNLEAGASWTGVRILDGLLQCTCTDWNFVEEGARVAKGRM